MKQISRFLTFPIVFAAGYAVPTSVAEDSPSSVAAGVHPPHEAPEALYRESMELERKLERKLNLLVVQQCLKDWGWEHDDKEDTDDEPATDVEQSLGDYETATGLYRRAAEQGYAPAQLAFARCCYRGRGVEKDAAMGRVWCLLAAEKDAGTRDSEGRTVLHVAADAGDTEACRRLLELGADVNAKNDCGRTPLYDAAENSQTEICKILLDHGADVKAKANNDDTPLHEAAQEGHAGICKLLLEYGAEVNAKGTQGWTPLHVAALEGHPEACKLLLELGADVDAKDGDGCTPLHNAAYGGHTDTCALLLEHGAEVNAEDEHGQTALRVAAEEGKTEASKLLRQYGAK